MSNLTYQSPDTPSQSPLTLSPVMTPSASTSSATAASSASSAASALLWTWIGSSVLPFSADRGQVALEDEDVHAFFQEPHGEDEAF